MFFRNLKLYQVTGDFHMPAGDELFQEAALRPCGSQDMATMGWVSPVPGGSALTHSTDGFTVLCLGKEERILPSSVVNQELETRVTSIERETGAPVGKRAKQELKQEIIHRLIPHAFTTRTYIYGVYMPSIGVVAVDTASDAKAETFLAFLRKTLGSLPVVPLARRSVSADLTEWLRYCKAPQYFQLLEDAILQSPDEEASKATWKNQDLGSEEINAALEDGKLVKQLSVEWDETLTCTITDDCTIKGIRFSDVIREKNEDIPKDQALAKWDADCALAFGELQRFISALISTFSLVEQKARKAA